MSDVKTISRQLYTDSIKHIYTFEVIPNSRMLNVDKISNILTIIGLYIKEANQKSAIPVKLSKDLKSILDIHQNIFYVYISRKNPGIPIEKINISQDFKDDSQNGYIFNSISNSLKNTLNSYLNTDQEFGLKNTKDSLEAMFALLLRNLSSYRGYFNLDGLAAFSNYSLVNSILSENSDEKSQFFNSPNTIDKSIAISSVNINNPVPYSTNKNWKTLFQDLNRDTFNAIIENIQIFYIKNSLINSLESVIYQEKATFDSKVNFTTPFTFEGEEITEGGIKKINITSKLTSNINTSDWLNHSVIYLNSSNASTKSKIIKIENENKLTLSPYNGLSVKNKQFSFLTISEGINIIKDFVTFTINNSNPRLFSLDVISDTNNTTIKTINFDIENSAFKNNYINFPIATSNPLNNGWQLDNQIKASNIPPNNSFKGSEVTENNIRKVKIMSILPPNVNISNWVNYGLTYFNSSNILTKSKITEINQDQKTLTLDPYDGISAKRDLFKFLETPEGINIINDFKSFTINKNNPILFSVEVIKDSNTINNIDFKIDNSAFNTNYIKFNTATGNPTRNGWTLNTKNPTSNQKLSLSFTKDPEDSDFILNKNNINSSGSTLHYDFRIDDTDLNQSFNMTFDYEILSENFSSEFLTLEIYHIENNTEKFIKKLKSLNSSSKFFSDVFTTNSFYINYRFKIKFNNFNNPLKISFNNFYVGKNDISSSNITYHKPKKLISDLFLTPLIKSNLDAFILYNEAPTLDSDENIIINYKLILSSEPSHKGSNIVFKITNINNNFNWFFNNKNLYTGLDPLTIINQSSSQSNNLNVTFYRDTTNNSFILNKGNLNSKNLKLYYNFSLESFDDNNQSLKINFDYKILTPNFSPSNLSLEICYTDRGNDVTLKTLKNLESTFNTNLIFDDSFNSLAPITGTYSISSGICIITAIHSFSKGQTVYLRFTSGNKPKNNYYTINSVTSTSFTVTVSSGSGTGNCNYSVKNSNNYKFKITFNDFTDPIRISFNNFYIGKDSINSNSITYTNPKKLINDLFLSSEVRNNRDSFISYSQSTSVNDQGISNTNYKLKISSEPVHTGSLKKFRFYNINPSLNWFLSEQIISGLNPIKPTDTGYEKKYYDSFISLNKKIFGIINAYAFSRLLVPEIFDEEQDVFNFGVKIDFDIKGYFSELLDELKDDLLFKNDLLKDPRSNFLGDGQPIDPLSRSAKWKSGGVKDALGLKQFTKFKSQLEKIKSTLKKVKSILDAIRAFISILEELIELGEDLLGALLDQVINQVQKVVDNIASTGVYWFPVIEYYALESQKSNSWWSTALSNDKLSYPVIVSPYPSDPNVTVNSTFLKELNDLQKANNRMLQSDLDMDSSRMNLKEGSGAEKDALEVFSKLIPFRSTTYQEFIDVIISGLLDEGDLPELGLTLKKDKKGKQKTEVNWPAIDSPNAIRPGAPKWGIGSQSAVVLVAIVLPAPEDFVSGYKGFLRILLGVLRPIAKVINFLYTNTSGGSPPVSSGATRKQGKLDSLNKEKNKITKEIKSLGKQIIDITGKIQKIESEGEEKNELTSQRTQLEKENSKLNKELADINKKINETNAETYSDRKFPFKINDWIKDLEEYLKTEESSSGSDSSDGDDQSIINEISDWWEESTLVDEALEDRGGKFTGSRGTYPDFLGYTIGSLAPGLFSVIKGFLRKLKKLNEKESTFNLSEKFEKLIEPITDYIQDIEDIIKAIDDIVNAIDAILNINISYLVIKTNNGIPDIVSQIEDATGFPEEDKRHIILGGLLGAGFVSPTGDEFNFNEYMNEAGTEFKEDLEDLLGDLKLSNKDAGISFLNKFFGG